MEKLRPNIRRLHQIAATLLLGLNVGLKGVLFASNVVPKPAMFASRGVYVCRPLQLTENKNQELYEKFETTRILHAVDALDNMRSIVSDQFNEDGFPKPPELRDKLLRLHEKAHNIINEYDCDTDLELFDLAWEIEEEIYDLTRYLDDIRKMIDDLTELCPSEEDEWEEEESKAGLDKNLSD